MTTEVQVCRNVGRPNPRLPNLVLIIFYSPDAGLRHEVPSEAVRHRRRLARLPLLLRLHPSDYPLPAALPAPCVARAADCEFFFLGL